jgi:nicotinate-nucleotide pyrophosphorylase (carboxylating)
MTSLKGQKNVVSLSEYLYRRNRISSYLEEDFGSGDFTSEVLVPRAFNAEAEVWCKETTGSVVICGVEEACMTLEICGCSTTKLIEDGSIVTNNQQVIAVKGNARSILKAERTALNMLMRMSGVATESRRYSVLLRKLGVDTQITATRKTSPGMRIFDKKAVMIGGGYPHRMGLYDMILIKDNHIEIVGDASDCVNKARRQVGKNREIECEVRSEDELISVVLAGVDIVMLDNFSVENAKHAMSRLRELGLRSRVKVEISGGINQSNFQDFAQLNPDFLSVGSMTHSTKAVDFSMIVKCKNRLT